jgi:hypothetical protein
LKKAEKSGKKVAIDAPEKPTPSIKFLGRNIFEHIQLHLKNIRSAELENTLRFLNQKQSFSLLFYLEHLLRNQVDIEVVQRAVIFVVKTYQVQLVMDKQMLGLLKSISLHMRSHFRTLKDQVGVNMCGLKVIHK